MVRASEKCRLNVDAPSSSHCGHKKWDYWFGNNTDCPGDDYNNELLSLSADII